MIFNTGASEVSRAEFDKLNESLSLDTTNLSAEFSVNALLQMLAERYFPNFTGTLYENGVIYLPLDGGTDWTLSNKTSVKSVFSDSYIEQSPTLAQCAIVGTQDLIDVTNYTKFNVLYSYSGNEYTLTMDISALSGEVYLSACTLVDNSTVSTRFFRMYATKVKTDVSANRLATAETSNLSTTATIYIHKMWLE